MSASGKRRGPPAEGHGGDERWVISYADLVTLLLGFFIILYSTSKVDADKFKMFAFGLGNAFNVDVRSGQPGGSPIHDGGRGLLPGPLNSGTIDRDLQTIQSEVEARAEGAGVGGQLIVTRQDDNIVIRLPNQLLFASASADIKPEAAPLLQVAAGVIADLPHQVRVEGHTDNVPVGTDRYPTNWELSAARATAVLRYLIEQGHVSAERTTAAGYAEHRPVASNNTPEGRAANRRADIVLLYPSARTSQPATPTADR
ncbi:MAG: flagellar motor protein MotB [Dehalococcoidia bacterium]